MGNWRLVVEGTGAHHNGQQAVVRYEDGREATIRGGIKYVDGKSVDNDGIPVFVLKWEAAVPNDANSLFIEFVKDLRSKGHTINLAQFQVLCGQVEYFTPNKDA